MDQKGREIVPYDTVLGKHEQFQMNGKINVSLLEKGMSSKQSHICVQERHLILCLKVLCKLNYLFSHISVQ